MYECRKQWSCESWMYWSFNETIIEQYFIKKMLNIINFREAKKLEMEETIFKWN
jgi:hypothetical protein